MQIRLVVWVCGAWSCAPSVGVRLSWFSSCFVLTTLYAASLAKARRVSWLLRPRIRLLHSYEQWGCRYEVWLYASYWEKFRFARKSLISATSKLTNGNAHTAHCIAEARRVFPSAKHLLRSFPHHDRHCHLDACETHACGSDPTWQTCELGVLNFLHASCAYCRYVILSLCLLRSDHHM